MKKALTMLSLAAQAAAVVFLYQVVWEPLSLVWQTTILVAVGILHEECRNLFRS